MIVNVFDLVSGRGVLAGRALARKALGKLIADTRSPSNSEVCILDFTATPLVTGSFIAEFVLGFSRHARATIPNLYPVTMMVDDISLQELEFVADSTNEVIPVCSGTTRGRLKDFRFLGSLDAVQQETIRCVAQLGRASAKDLAATSKHSNVGLTAWHNRLAALNRKGLIIEESDGRQKLYRSLT